MPGPDEDALTMAAAALERLSATGGTGGSALPVELLDAAPGLGGEELAAVLGRPVELHRHAPTAAAFREALRSAAERAAPGLVLAVSDDATSAGAEIGAIAVRTDPTSHEPWERFGPMPAAGETVGQFLHRYAPPSASGPDRPGAGGAAGALPLLEWTSAPTASAPSGLVSQGAYLPRPRYLEGVAGGWRLEAEQCGRCGATGFPPRGRCRSCGSDGPFSVRSLAGEQGMVVAVTWIGAGGQPTEFDAQVAASGPYGVVWAEFPTGERATLQLADVRPGTVGVGDPVATALRRLYAIDGEWRYGRKAVPVAAPGPATG